MKKYKIIILIIVILLSFLSILFFISNKKTEEISSPTNTTAEKPENKTSQSAKTILEINEKRYEAEVAGKTNVYDFMAKLRNEGKIDFTEKNYTGIGKFINTIDGIKGGGEKNWIYYVNGIKAQVGVSNYEIKPGDIVSWKYEKYE